MTDHLQTLRTLRTARFEDTNHPRVTPAEHDALSHVIGLLDGTTLGDPISWAIIDVAAERRAQFTIHGWSSEHDDQHAHGEIANAAADFASTGQAPIQSSWAYGSKVVDKEPRRRQLVKAGALVIAEIERLDRSATCKGCGHVGGFPQDKVSCCPDGRRSVSSSPDQTATKTPAWSGGDYVSEVTLRDAAVAYRARIACDILEGFTDGIDGDRLGELARWVTHGRALDAAALLRAFAAPWIAASKEAGWEGDADAEARKDIDRHTITARVRGATSFTPDQLATIFARHNELKAAAANALEVASSHIQHMASWISKTNASDTPLHGYSFEALGEDKWIIDQALAALKAEVVS